MKLELNDVVFSNSEWTAEEKGTLINSLDATDKVKFAKIKADKQVTILITEKGHTEPNKQVVCSKAVTSAIRKAVAAGQNKKALLKSVLGLNVIKNEIGYFLSAPKGEMGESFSLAELKKETEVELFNPEEVIA